MFVTEYREEDSPCCKPNGEHVNAALYVEV